MFLVFFNLFFLIQKTIFKGSAGVLLSHCKQDTQTENFHILSMYHLDIQLRPKNLLFFKSTLQSSKVGEAFIIQYYHRVVLFFKYSGNQRGKLAFRNHET